MKNISIIVLTLMMTLTACAPALVPPAGSPTPNPVEEATPTSTPIPPSPTQTQIPTPQPRYTPQALGPEADTFPAGINPLTAREVKDPTLLGIPAALVSISNSPVTARPQHGVAFADWIFELFIGTGTTRFLGVFYGEYPRDVRNFTGQCEVREEVLRPQAGWLGNRVWHDENGDGLQQGWEQGVGGVCVSLLDAATGSPLAQTSTDSNGYYAFEGPFPQAVTISIQLPESYAFTAPHVGDDDRDSDVDPQTGQTPPISPTGPDASWDAGLLLAVSLEGVETFVKPIRSGRLTYRTINKMFPFSCLFFAGAGDGIFERLDACKVIYGETPEDVNDGFITTTEMRQLSEANKAPNQPVNYSGHRFEPQPPAGGLDAQELLVYYHNFNQGRWQYDPVSGSYLRWTDFQDGSGVFTPALDAWTGRQLAFENVIVIFADHNIFRHLQYDITITPGLEGYAFALRDGQLYKIRWSTGNRAWEAQSGLLRPIHFIWPDKTDFPLKPGRTFIHIMTPYSGVTELTPGSWRALFVVPNDPAPDE